MYDFRVSWCHHLSGDEIFFISELCSSNWFNRNECRYTLDRYINWLRVDYVANLEYKGNGERGRSTHLVPLVNVNSNGLIWLSIRSTKRLLRFSRSHSGSWLALNEKNVWFFFMEQKSRIRTWESVNFNSLASSSTVLSISRVHLPECNTREPISFVGIALCKMPPFWRKCSIGTALWVWDWWIMNASCETSWIGIVVWMVWRSIARKHKHEALLDRGKRGESTNSLCQ